MANLAYYGWKTITLTFPQTCKGGIIMDEIMQEKPYKVLVRVDDAGRVVSINSDAFVTDTGGWTEVLLP